MISQHLATLIQAVKQVSPELVSNCNLIEKELYVDYLEERSFAYELYRQWQDLIENNDEDLVINAEVAKKCVDEHTFLSRLENIFGLTKEGKPHRCFYPDLVCHHSQFDSENQEIICEIKTKKGIDDSKNAKLNKDLKKLAAYMTDEVLLYHPFKIGVFILVGGVLNDIKNKYVSNDWVKNKVNDIYCISYNIKMNDEDCPIPDIVCMSLYEVLQLNDK